ncbi:MAG: hypothetical protein AB4352_26295 [Hormoscilla sp.]
MQRYTLKKGWLLTAALTLGLTFVEIGQYDSFGQSRAAAQVRIRPSQVWRVVYEKLPELPKENHYVNRETGEVDRDNTLIRRLLRYHIFVKSRPPQYRLDWKLTLADYLDANEVISESIYPGHDLLRENPRDGDRSAIARLNRQQRDALVEVLASIYNPNYQRKPIPRRSPAPEPADVPSRPPVQPQPGDAQLLMP